MKRVVALLFIMTSLVTSVFAGRGLKVRNTENTIIGVENPGVSVKSSFQKGYMGAFEFSGTAGFKTYGRSFLEFCMINGYRLNPHLSLGLGLGVKYDLDESPYMVPVFLDFRYILTKRKVSPYIAVDGGYSFDISTATDGYGVFGNLDFGVIFQSSNRSAWYIGIRAEVQKTSYEMYKYYISGGGMIGGTYYYSYKRNPNFKEYSKGLGVKIGFSF